MTLKLTCARCTCSPNINLNGTPLCGACAHREIDRASPQPRVDPIARRARDAVLDRLGREAKARFDALPVGFEAAVLALG